MKADRMGEKRKILGIEEVNIKVEVVWKHSLSFIHQKRRFQQLIFEGEYLFGLCF